VLDLRDAFASGYVLPSLKADATGEDGAPMPSLLGKALVAEKLVDLARIEQAAAVAHGPASPHEEAAAVLDNAIRAIDPAMRVVALPHPASVAGVRAFRAGVNLWGRTIERIGPSGTPEDVPESAYKITRAPGACPAEPASVEIRFERGVPVSVNGVPMPLVELIASLTYLAGAHGVGRVLTPLAAIEAPAAVVLHEAHRELQKHTANKDGDRVSRQYADIITRGLWPTGARAALDKIVEKSQKRVNGSVRVKLFNAVCQLVSD
jgi:argininosuccinate synthase